MIAAVDADRPCFLVLVHAHHVSDTFEASLVHGKIVKGGSTDHRYDVTR